MPLGELPSGCTILPVPVDVPSGWECPRCKHVYAPLTAECWRCAPPPPVVTAADLPRPADTAWSGCMRPDGPTEGERPMPGYCCVCGSAEIAYLNFKDLPFCRPCANGEPLGNLKPVHIKGMRCKPPCDGGMCGCAEPDDNPAHRLFLRLPPEMANEGCNRIVRFGAGFTEIVPGLEGAVFLPPDDKGEVIAHFRLTPKDGQGHG